MNSNNKIFRSVLALAVIVGFFLPWFAVWGSTASGLDIVTESSAGEPNQATATIVRYSFLLIPFFALIVLIRSISNKSSSFFLRLLPFLVTAILTALFIVGILDEGGNKETLNSWCLVLK